MACTSAAWLSPSRPELDPAVLEKLDQYLTLLLRWNGRINLIAEHDPDLIRRRHIEDCLQLRLLLPPGPGVLADLGSGAGLPGIILASLDDRPMHLVESDRRKAAFLAEAAGRLRLRHVTVHPRRIEDIVLPPLAVVTCRALAPLPTLLAHASRLLGPQGVAIFPKGRSVECELTAARADWTFRLERFPSSTDPKAAILRLSDIRRDGRAS